MKRKLQYALIALFLLTIVFASLAAEKAQAATCGDGKNFSFDISGLSDRMQASAVFTAAEYKGDLYFVCLLH